MYKIIYEPSGRVAYSGDYWDCKEHLRIFLEDDEDFYIEDPDGNAVA